MRQRYTLHCIASLGHNIAEVGVRGGWLGFGVFGLGGFGLIVFHLNRSGVGLASFRVVVYFSSPK